MQELVEERDVEIKKVNGLVSIHMFMTYMKTELLFAESAPVLIIFLRVGFRSMQELHKYMKCLLIFQKLWNNNRYV